MLSSNIFYTKCINEVISENLVISNSSVRLFLKLTLFAALYMKLRYVHIVFCREANMLYIHTILMASYLSSLYVCLIAVVHCIESTKIIFEMSSLAHVSPQTICCCSVVHCSNDTVPWKCLVDSWCHDAVDRWFISMSRFAVFS